MSNAADAIHLTLPKVRSRSTRKQRPPWPPNWKQLLAFMVWDVVVLVVCVVSLAGWGTPWAPFTGGAAIVDLQATWRVWKAGGAYPVGRPLFVLAAALYLVGVVVSFYVVLV